MNELASLEQEQLALNSVDPREQYFNELAFTLECDISMLSGDVAVRLRALYDSYLNRYEEGRLDGIIWLLECLRLNVNAELYKAQEQEYYTDDSMVRQLINMQGMKR